MLGSGGGKTAKQEERVGQNEMKRWVTGEIACLPFELGFELPEFFVTLGWGGSLFHKPYLLI